MRILRIDIKISFHKFFGQGISVLLSSKHSFPSFSVFMEFRKPRGRTRRKYRRKNIVFNNLTLSVHPCSLRNILRSENLRFREIPLETLSSDQERRDFSIHRFSIDPQKGNIHFFYFGHPYRNMKRTTGTMSQNSYTKYPPVAREFPFPENVFSRQKILTSEEETKGTTISLSRY